MSFDEALACVVCSLVVLTLLCLVLWDALQPPTD